MTKPNALVLIFGVCGTFIGFILLSSSNFSSNFTSSRDLILSNIPRSIKDETPLTTFNINFVVSNTTKLSDTLKKFCEREQCVERFRPYPNSSVFYVPQYKLSHCAIPKSLSTITLTMLCFLHDPEDFKNRSLTMTEGNRTDRVCRREYSRRGPDIDRLTLRDWTHMAVVRNPIDRLISGFVEKCIDYREKKIGALNLKQEENFIKKLNKLDTKWCLGCRDNLTCFIHKNYEKLLKSQETNRTFPLEGHFYPQTWFCSFSKYIDYYTIMRFPSEKKYMKDFYEAIGNVLQSRKVPQNLTDTIKEQISTQKTDHATSGTYLAKFYRNWLYSDKELLKTVVKTYFYDFVTFEYDFPQF